MFRNTKKSVERQIVVEADRVASMKESLDALSWDRVAEIGKQLQNTPNDEERYELARELLSISQANTSLFGKLGISTNSLSGKLMGSGVEVLQKGSSDMMTPSGSREFSYSNADFPEPEFSHAPARSIVNPIDTITPLVPDFEHDFSDFFSAPDPTNHLMIPRGEPILEKPVSNPRFPNENRSASERFVEQAISQIENRFEGGQVTSQPAEPAVDRGASEWFSVYSKEPEQMFVPEPVSNPPLMREPQQPVSEPQQQPVMSSQQPVVVPQQQPAQPVLEPQQQPVVVPQQPVLESQQPAFESHQQPMQPVSEPQQQQPVSTPMQSGRKTNIDLLLAAIEAVHRVEAMPEAVPEPVSVADEVSQSSESASESDPRLISVFGLDAKTIDELGIEPEVLEVLLDEYEQEMESQSRTDPGITSAESVNSPKGYTLVKEPEPTPQAFQSSALGACQHAAASESAPEQSFASPGDGRASTEFPVSEPAQNAVNTPAAASEVSSKTFSEEFEAAAGDMTTKLDQRIQSAKKKMPKGEKKPSDEGSVGQKATKNDGHDLANFKQIYESRDGSLCLYRDAAGHIVAIDSSKFA